MKLNSYTRTLTCKSYLWMLEDERMKGRKKERFWSFLFDLQLYNTLCEMTVTTNRVCNFQQCKPQKPFGITNGSSSSNRSNRSNRSTKVAFSIHFQLMKVHSIRLPMTHTHSLAQRMLPFSSLNWISGMCALAVSYMVCCMYRNIDFIWIDLCFLKFSLYFIELNVVVVAGTTAFKISTFEKQFQLNNDVLGSKCWNEVASKCVCVLLFIEEKRTNNNWTHPHIHTGTKRELGCLRDSWHSELNEFSKLI